jgi:hypothetical protein
MYVRLTTDEFDALEQIRKAYRRERPSACVARNTKRLAGLKYVAYERDGHLAITEKGKQALFVKRCIDGLRAVAGDPLTKLDADVATFLGKKGHVTAGPSADGFEITQKGRESLTNIDATGGG